MKDLIKKLWEHLKTRKKYNTLLLKYEVKMDEFQRLEIRYKEREKLYRNQKEIWENKLKEQEETIIELKKRGVKRVSKSKAGSPKVARKEQDNK